MRHTVMNFLNEERKWEGGQGAACAHNGKTAELKRTSSEFKVRVWIPLPPPPPPEGAVWPQTCLLTPLGFSLLIQRMNW